MIGRWLDTHQPCVMCGAADAISGWCAPCLESLPRNSNICCELCATPMAAPAPLCGACLRQRPHFDRLQTGLCFDYPLSGLIVAWKYQRCYELSGAFAELVRCFIPDTECIDVIVPVPLARQRLAERGFNQSAVLASAISDVTKCRYDDCLCWRNYNTESQANLDAAGRRKNLRNAFGVNEAVRGLSVLLVDDVATSCSTLSELSKSFKKHGAKRVEAWALTRAILRKT